MDNQQMIDARQLELQNLIATIPHIEPKTAGNESMNQMFVRLLSELNADPVAWVAAEKNRIAESERMVLSMMEAIKNGN